MEHRGQQKLLANFATATDLTGVSAVGPASNNSLVEAITKGSESRDGIFISSASLGTSLLM